jgi:hypothetical protein
MGLSIPASGRHDFRGFDFSIVRLGRRDLEAANHRLVRNLSSSFLARENRSMPLDLPKPVAHRIEVPFSFRAVRYRAVLDAKLDPPLWVEGPNGHRYPSSMSREWGPWKLQVGDVDGDGYPDLLVGVVKATHQLHARHTTLFVYTFNGREIRRKWLGSTMGRPLLDYTLGKAGTDGWQPLFTLERTLDGNASLSRYRWRVFGFHRNSSQLTWKNAIHLRSIHGMITLDANGRRFALNPGTWK